jgi:hypothetical protein
MEIALRTQIIEWLRTAPALSGLNAIEEESPLKASTPWLGLAASRSSDWSTKDRQGREVRLAFELQTRSDEPATDSDFIAAIEQRLASLPPAQPDFTVINSRFLRARAERRSNNRRATLLEYRFRLLAN